MKVLFMVDSLGLGGTERVVATLLRHLAPLLRARGHTASLFVAGPERDMHGLLPADLSLYPVLGPPGRMRQRFLRVRSAFNRIAHNFDVIVPATPHMLAVATGSGRLVLPWVHFNWRGYRATVPRAQRLVARALYPFRPRVVSVSASALSGLAALPWQRRVVIPNVFDPAGYAPATPELRARLAELRASGRPLLAFVGRLSVEKGVDRLMRAYSRLAGACDLVVAGDGPLRGLVTGPGVTYLGPTESPLEVLQAADAVLVPSRVESFGMGLVEATWARRPAVAFDCPTGPRDLLQGELGRFIVPDGDLEAFVSATQRALASPWPGSCEHFREQLLLATAPDSVSAEWVALLEDACRV